MTLIFGVVLLCFKLTCLINGNDFLTDGFDLFTVWLRSRKSVHVGAAVLPLCLLAGCGKPGYMVDTERMAARLKTVAVKENVERWVGAEIGVHLAAVTNRPMSFRLTKSPSWIEEVYGPCLYYEIEFEPNPENDHVSFFWSSGIGGGWGVLLGGPKFEPNTNRFRDSDFYMVKSSRGLYAWHSRRDG